MEDKTYTEEELKAALAKAVAEAVSPLEAKVAELESSQQQSEVDKAIAAVKAEKDAEIADLQKRLDESVIEATAAKEAKEAQDKFWTDAIAEQEEKAAREARRETRVAALKEHAGFTDEYLTENVERFLAMTDEEFTARLDEYKTLKDALGVPAGTPSTTALTASRQTSPSSSSSALREAMALRREGVDPRRVIA